MTLAKRLGPVFALALLIVASPGTPQDDKKGKSGPGPADITPACQTTIKRGSDWLVKNQNRDGSWGIDGMGAPDITCTALGALALMAKGNTDRGGPNGDACEAVRKALNYILSKAKKSRGDIAGGETTLIQGKLGKNVHTFFATVFLTQAYGVGGAWVGNQPADEIREAIVKMCEAISKTQEPDGSWHKETFGALKATAMAWLALRSARSAGINVGHASSDKTVQFIRKSFNASSGFFDISGSMSHSYQRIYNSSSSLRILFGMGEGHSTEAQKGARAIIKELKEGAMASQYLSVEGEDYLTAALMSQALIQDRNGLWKEWYPFIREALIKKQSGEGTWTGTACISGRMFATSCSLICLQVPYRQLPIQEE